MRKKGKIIKWNVDKGFGFIRPFDSKQDIFVHITKIQRKRTPNLGDVITYTQSADKNGRPCAVDAVLAGDKLIKKIKRKTKKGYIGFAVLYLLAYIGLSFSNHVPVLLVILLLGFSLITYLMYAIDKTKAQNNHWRIPESTLQILSLAGGWPGALIAQQTLRHKSSKMSFIITLWAMVLLSIFGYLWIITEKGKPILDMLQTLLPL